MGNSGIMGFPDVMGFRPPGAPEPPKKERFSPVARKETRKEIKDAMADVISSYQEQVVRLLSNQSGSGGFTLRNIATVTGTPGGTAKLIPMKDANGTEGYVPWYPSYS